MLKKREEKLKIAALRLDFRDAVKYLASWSPLTMHKLEGKLSRFPDTSRNGVIVDPEFFAQERDGILNAHTVEYSGDFFADLICLYRKCPVARLYHSRDPENCSYTDMTVDSKNCYLSFVPVRSENVLYSFNIKDSKDIISSVSVRDGSSCIFESSCVVNSHEIFYSSYVVGSSQLRGCSGMRNCHHCRDCHDMEFASYCIENVSYSPEEYEKKLASLKGEPRWYKNFKQYAGGEKGPNFASTGCDDSSRCISCSDLEYSMNSFQIHTGRNVFMSSSAKGSEERYNSYLTGNANRVYSIMHSGGGAEYCYNCIGVNRCTHVYYSVRLQTCSFCLGCVGLQNASYCIFNKQYSKEERHKKVDEIFAALEAEGTLGGFFPADLNPFYFNDTIASLLADFSKEEIVQEGYLWRDEQIMIDIPDWMEKISVKDVSEFEKSGLDSRILKKILIDEKGAAYRVVKMEFDFLIRYGLPLPRLHWMERLKIKLYSPLT